MTDPDWQYVGGNSARVHVWWELLEGLNRQGEGSPEMENWVEKKEKKERKGESKTKEIK